MKARLELFFALALAVNFISGCATMPHGGSAPSSVQQAARLIEREAASDARFWKVRGREFLVFDHDLKLKFSDYANLSGLENKRDFTLGLLDEAKQTGDKAIQIQLQRIPEDKIFAVRPDLAAVYASEAERRLNEEKNRVRALGAEDELDRYVTRLENEIEESIKTKGRTLRQILLLPFAPFVKLWMHNYAANALHHKGGVEYGKVDRFNPPVFQVSSDVTSMSDDALLAFYAPVVVVEHKEDIRYDRDSDRFGNIRMEGAGVRNAQPIVDTHDPTVFGYAETKRIGGQAVKMLVYTLWFPERPSIDGGFDPEVGSTQGAMIRISLNHKNMPVIYENVSSCGCYYKIFPTENAEKFAQKHYDISLEDKHYVVENHVPGKIDADVPNLVASPSEPARAIIFFSAGTHEVMDIRLEMPATTQEISSESYRLLAYEALENLPYNGATISMFDTDGLVRNADRAEAALLAASGMYHAGTPRQRGTLMIYFDQADFDDPNLLTTYLRISSELFGETG